jgi:CBS domain-containing protein
MTYPIRRVAEAMSPRVISCPPDMPLREVAAVMADERIHALYVFDFERDAPGLWGLVSDLDLVAAGRGDVDEATARDAAVTPLVTARSDDPLEYAAQLMAENGVSHLAIVDGRGNPVGVLSTLDLARVLASARR